MEKMKKKHNNNNNNSQPQIIYEIHHHLTYLLKMNNIKNLKPKKQV